MRSMPCEFVDMIFADPPYFLSNGGLSYRNGKVVSVDKGEWDKKCNYKNIDDFTYDWLKEVYRILKKGRSIWVSGTHHNIFDIERNMKILGFKIINIIIWHKINPPPLIFKNKFRFSHEMIIWASKGKNDYFDYDSMYKINNDEMHDVWNLNAVMKEEKSFGYHPTQKPEILIERIIKSTTKKGEIILDPFMGSGTTGVVAKKHKRKFIGIEKEKEFFELSSQRINSII